MAKKKSSFRNKVTANSHKQKSQGAAYGYLQIPKGVDIFKEEPDSRVTLDFLPYEVQSEKHMDRDDRQEIALPGELWYKRPFLIHRNIGVSDEAVVCPTSIDKKCPICEYRSKMMKEGAGKDEIKALRPSRRNLYVVVPLDHKDYEEKPHLWDISQFLFQDMLNDEIDDNPDFDIFPDLEEGLSLRIRFRSASIGSGKPFAEVSRIDFKERKEGYDEKILKNVPNLDECLLIHPYVKLEHMFLELDDEDVPDSIIDDEEPEPEKAVTKKTATKKPDPEDEDEDSEDEENTCVACEGSGKNSKGKTCRICKGTGKAPKKEKEEKEDPDNPCPHGHIFGTDFEKFDECDDCKKWDECIDAQE